MSTHTAPILLSLSLVAATLSAQGSAEDYQRAADMRRQTRDRVWRTSLDLYWSEDESVVCYRVQTSKRAHEFVLVDTGTGDKREAFDHRRLASQLAMALESDVSAERLPLEDIVVEIGAGEEPAIALGFRAGKERWRYELSTGELTRVSAETGSETRGVDWLDDTRPSRGSSDETELRFVNRLERPVELWWIDPGGKPVSYGRVEPGESHAQHTYAGHVWQLRDTKGKVLGTLRATEQRGVVAVDGKPPRRQRAQGPSRRSQRGSPRSRSTSPSARSPDGLLRAFIRDHDVWLSEKESGEETRLSKDGSEEHAYLDRFWWSPDGTRLVALRERRHEKRQVHFVESSPRDQLQPRLHSHSYVKPGDPIDQRRPRLFDVAGKKPIEVSTALFPNPWRVSHIRWRPDSREFTFLYNERGHQALRIVGVDAKTGSARAIVDERSRTFIDYAHKTFSHLIEERDEIVWLSERDGWNHLWLYDARLGKVKRQLTRGEWVVRGVERVDEEKRQIWFRASGMDADQDPYFVHWLRVDIDTGELTRLTRGDGTHRVEFSPGAEFLIDRYSRVDLPTVTELRRTKDGSLVCELERGDWSELRVTGWRPPERFHAPGRDGRTPIHGIILRPTNFREDSRYPIVEKIYAGPHGSHVPKSFAAHRRAQEIAELGFIVVQIDGMGTSNRSKAFHDVAARNLGDAGFPDRIRWIRAAAERYPQLDLERIGIYGGSAGGQNALRALLAHGDFYKVAVADCGCHDNRMDKIWWNELWMGWPIGSHYAEQSNVTQAHRLQGKLLLIVGELDRNVDPASTMQVVDALVRADKDFDLIVIPGAGHGAAGTSYGRRRQRDFLVRHLHGVEPRWE